MPRENQTRCSERVTRFLSSYEEEVCTGADSDETIRDLITDLYHLCDKQGYDFDDIRRVAFENYLGERADDNG